MHFREAGTGLYARFILNYYNGRLTIKPLYTAALFKKTIQIHVLILAFQDELYVIIGNLDIQRVRLGGIVKIIGLYVKLAIALFYQDDRVKILVFALIDVR
jgi:hypothetical protein